MNVLLKEYFTEPKVVHKREIFLICSSKIKRSTALWFKVNSLEMKDDRCNHIETNALFVDERFTNVYLSNPVKSCVPVCSCSVQNNARLIPFYRNPFYHNAFQNVFTQISNILELVYNQKVGVRETMILLEGCRGVGKGMLVRSICHEKCIHYYEVNCFDLIGDSLSATEKRIENIFQLVKSTSPCVFYLKNVHVLCKDREGLHEERRVLQCFINQVEKLHIEDKLLIIGSTYKANDMSSRFRSQFI